jgi:hypothetical protein
VPSNTTASDVAGATTNAAGASTGDSIAAPVPKRDLAAELRTLVGDPSSCFAKRTAGSGPSTLTLDVNATVTPSGMITRASVTGAGLDALESECLGALVMRARFRNPVDGAPRNVQASIELREQPKPAKAPAAPPNSP